MNYFILMTEESLLSMKNYYFNTEFIFFFFEFIFECLLGTQNCGCQEEI